MNKKPLASLRSLSDSFWSTIVRGTLVLYSGHRSPEVPKVWQVLHLGKETLKNPSPGPTTLVRGTDSQNPWFFLLGSMLADLGSMLAHLVPMLARLGPLLSYLCRMLADLGSMLAYLGSMMGYLGAKMTHQGSNMANLASISSGPIPKKQKTN